MKIFLPMYVQKIIKIIEDKNKEAFVVGGCVRDSLLGKKPSDWDITTSMLPEEMKEAFSDYKLVNKNGEKHGTITVIIEGKQVEVTTYRVDSDYLDGRHPRNVSFSSSLKEDLTRRDFTMNALAYNEKTGLIDLVGGLNDIEKKTIRCVGDATKRFNEDYLRILRALRFSSKLGFKICEDDIPAIFNLKDKLKLISWERIGKELEGILIGKNVFKVLMEYREVLSVFIPELIPCFDFDQSSKYHKHDVYTHTCYVVSNTKANITTRMAALLHDIGKPIVCTEDGKYRHFYGHQEVSRSISSEILKRLRFANKISENILFLIKYHDVAINEDKKDIRKIMSTVPNYSLELFAKLIDLKCADRSDHICYGEEINYDNVMLIAKEIMQERECMDIKQLKINGYDMMELGFKGKEIKKGLTILLSLVIDGKIENQKEILIEKLKEIKEVF